ncbi:MAG: hypothetical protein HDR09_21190 [Lachnospiraceae bacterium]|nr:hypothetical protein [Lachnospiraceae bacterium]
MIQITVQGEQLDLPQDFSLSIEESSPIYNDTGSTSISVELPATAKNRRLFGFPARTDSMLSDRVRGVRCIVYSGAYLRTGTINVESATETSISVNIGYDNAVAYDAWKTRKLADLESLPCYEIRDLRQFSSFIASLFYWGHPDKDDLAVFPVCVARETVEKDDVSTEYPEILNERGTGPFLDDGAGSIKVTRVIDSEPTEVTVPYGYGCTPFVKVWKILECVFADIGLSLDRNPFLESIDLSRLVVLNNTADTVCYGTLDYAELMPDCTVDEFLQALFVRFGLVYRTDFDSGTAYVRLLREIAADHAQRSLDDCLSAPPDTEYMSPQYVRLSAGTSLEGAAPMAARLEDFLRGYGIDNIYPATDPKSWNAQTRPPGFVVDPDGPPLRQENRPATQQRAAGVGPMVYISDYCDEITRGEKPDTNGYRFSWDAVSGKWYRASTVNGQYLKEESSSFFNWDPAPEGFDPLDLISPDEWCPLERIRTGDKDTLMPAFLTGSRHFHTYLEHDGEEDRGDCPLSFMFAMTGFDGSVTTEGRLSADVGLDEEAHTFADGSTHEISLYFQFCNGLYANYWRDYDMMLRSADRKISLSGRMLTTELRDLDVLRPFKAGEVPMLTDTSDITLTDGPEATFEMTALPFVRHTGADVPPFSMEVPDFPPSGSVL